MRTLFRLILLFIIFFIPSTSYCNGYKGYIKLKPEECVILDKSSVVSKLPMEWHKYAGFIKRCELRQKNTSTSQISVISIWAHDYLNTQAPNAPWEKFPLPIIIDCNFVQVGQLNELYPSDWVTDLNVYFGKWQLGIPAEIRVDVENPAVSGDYYYAPLIWNKKNKSYEMKSKRTINGSRPY